MAGAAVKPKRARAAAFTEHERYMHKSSVVLQREGKKIRAFLVRRAVAQLKLARTQQQEANAKVEAITDDAKRKRAQGKAKKLMYQVEKLEKELVVLKTLDLKAVVARAFERTGLQVEEEEEEEEEEEKKLSAHDREMAKYGRGRVVEEEEEFSRHHNDVDEDDDGFDSEDYDEAPRADVSDSDSDSNSEEEEDDEEKSDSDEQEENQEEQEEASSEEHEEHEEDVGSEEEQEEDSELHVVEAQAIEDGAILFGPAGPPGTTATSETKPSEEDTAMIDQLIDRVLTHNQMQPFLDAIRQYVAKKTRDQEKKRRQKEKSALKRARASMIGGRSAAAPTSMFFGSLSGDAPDDDDDIDMGVGRASMAGAEDDIAEFLGETKKKKNRPGQMARRQKAMRMEEARRREQDGGDVHGRDGKRRFPHRESPSIGKYGPSERPKKQQKNEQSSGRPRGGDRPASSDKWQSDRRPRTEAPRPAAAKATPKPTPQRKPEAEPSHPSWLAKQAMKEKMKVDINAFAGKKITFGDD